jgi:hypothetical protein
MPTYIYEKVKTGYMLCPALKVRVLERKGLLPTIDDLSAGPPRGTLLAQTLSIRVLFVGAKGAVLAARLPEKQKQ